MREVKNMDTLRVANRSPTPASKINDSLGLFDDIWGARGPHSRPILGVPGARAGPNKYILCSPLTRQVRIGPTQERLDFWRHEISL